MYEREYNVLESSSDYYGMDDYEVPYDFNMEDKEGGTFEEEVISNEVIGNSSLDGYNKTDQITENKNNPVTHITQQGETLWGVAKRYYGKNKDNLGTTWDEYWKKVQEWNKGGNYGQVGGTMYLSAPESRSEKAHKLLKQIITTREEWGADKPITGGDRSYEDITKGENFTSLEDYYHTIAIHHAGNVNHPTIKDIQKKHQGGGKADVGYHYAIDTDGRIYEGRPIEIKGAHVNNANTGVIGIVLLGDFEPGFDYYIIPDIGTTFTRQMRNALIILCKLLDIAYTIENGLSGHNGLNCGHTVCPGSKVTSELDLIRKLTGLKEADCINHEKSGD